MADEDPCKNGHDMEFAYEDNDGRMHYHCKNCIHSETRG